MRAWLFAGQGAQRPGMGAELFRRFPDRADRASEILGYSITQLCGEDPGGRLRSTEFAQPALFVVGALGHLEARERQAPPDFLAGHSLGELCALFAAGCFSFETGLRLVARRGRLMAAASGGSMLAIIDVGYEAIRHMLDELGIDDLDVANHNSDNQLVLSGPQPALDRVAAHLKRVRQGRSAPLHVSAAFHSRYMADAARRFATFLDEQQFRPPEIPVVANVTAEPYPADGLGAILARQIDSPVRWRDSMRYLKAQGVDQITEIGPGRTLTGLWQTAGEPPIRRTTGEPAVRLPAAGQTGGAERLGSADFRRDYGVRLAYLAGSMFRGVASVDLVARMAGAGLLGFFGTGGLTLKEIEDAVEDLQRRVPGRFGMNLLHVLDEPELEREIADLYLHHDVRFIEAAAFTQPTEQLIRLRFRGATADVAGPPVLRRNLVVKVSRPDVAAAFLRPAPAALVDRLLDRGDLTRAEADIARRTPVSGDLCVESDSAGHTDGGVALTLLPTICRLRDQIMAEHGFAARVRVGASGGLGTPEAVAASFLLGADFVLTGSVNQCTPQAGTSDAVKDLLAEVDVHDMAYAPAGDMFEMGARVQVVRRGTMFAARANQLYQLYRRFESLDEIDAQTRATIERTFLRRTFAEVWEETCEHYRASGRAAEIAKAQTRSKLRMAMVFKWYFAHSIRLALAGDPGERVNYQVHCGPAMGAFNSFVRGTGLQDWRRRDVDAVADALMTGAAQVLSRSRIRG